LFLFWYFFYRRNAANDATTRRDTIDAREHTD